MIHITKWYLMYFYCFIAIHIEIHQDIPTLLITERFAKTTIYRFICNIFTKFAYKNIRECVLVTISATKTISYPYEEKFLNRPGFENLT